MTISAEEGEVENSERTTFVATWMVSRSSPVVRRYVRTGRMACFLFLLVVVSTVFTIREKTDGAVHEQTSMRMKCAGTPPQGGPTL